MLLSVAMILSIGMLLGSICKRIKLPPLIGMLLTGIILGPCVLNLIDPSISLISADLRKIALVIILFRAGLGLDLSGLKKNGRPAFLMCFLPATFEILGVLLLAPLFLGFTYLEALILGSILAAVSPAVVVPRMVKLMDEGYGVKEGIPQVVLAGASVDDVYVIVLFTTFLGMAQGKEISVLSFVNIPVSIVLGALLGIGISWLMAKFFEKIHMRDTVKVLIILCASLFLVAIENMLTTSINFSGLIGVMFIGIGLSKYRGEVAKRLSLKFGKLWVGAEIFLFVLVGATVNIGSLKNTGITAIILIFLALVARMLGVFICLIGAKMNIKEKLFTMISYTPKATVQAAIGGMPLAIGLSCGDTVLTVAVLAIVITAPLGAFFIDLTYKKFLKPAN